MHVTAYQDDPWALLMFVPDVAPVQDLVTAQNVEVLRTTEGYCIAIVKDDPLRGRIHELGLCTGCALTWTVPRDDLHSSRGLYDYVHSNLCENWIAGPYVRIRAPIRPLVADELPPRVREHAIRFPGRFADTVELQPAAYWTCRAHSNTWLATDYKTQRSFETGAIVTDEDDE